jgi:hypothetical protein
MVSKCVNPTCKERFTYFGTGELLVKTSPATGRQELFWLCEQCATEWQKPSELMPLKPAGARTSRKTAAA